MQCQSYFPRYNSHYDHVKMDNNNGGVRPINGPFQSGHYSSQVPSFPVAEFMRQTILMQEKTFRDQVQELHRLYSRQKELMGEIKSKQLSMNHLLFRPRCSDPFLTKLGQTTLVNGGPLNSNVAAQEPKGRKIGRKFLDLELPAEEYIDEGDDCFETPNSTSGSNMRPSSLADLNEPLTTFNLVDKVPRRNDSAIHQDSPQKLVSGLDLNSPVVEEIELSHSDTSSSKLDRCSKDVTPLSHEDPSSRGKRSRLIDINWPCDLTTEPEEDHHQPIIEDDKNPPQTNLNLSMNDDGLPPKRSSVLEKISLDIDLEAPPPPIPEPEERPPPRGDSEETTTTTTTTTTTATTTNTTLEDGSDTLDELLKNAVEAIVSVASVEPRSFPKKCGSSGKGSLEWFAGLVVGSVSSDPDTDFTSEGSNSNTLDEFEALTLNLLEMKREEYYHWCQESVQTDNISCCSMPLAGQESRKGRSQRSKKRKDFQKEVLPSLASLSRYEVTEDIQMIEGLMEAAGTPWQLARTRRGCRMAGRKPRGAKTECFVFEKPVLDPKNEALKGWGKPNRRRRGQRSPASPSTVLSRWLEYVMN